MLAPDIAYVVVRRYARWWAHPLSTDAWLVWHRLQPLTGGRGGVTLHCKSPDRT